MSLRSRNFPSCIRRMRNTCSLSSCRCSSLCTYEVAHIHIHIHIRKRACQACKYICLVCDSRNLLAYHSRICPVVYTHSLLVCHNRTCPVVYDRDPLARNQASSCSRDMYHVGLLDLVHLQYNTKHTTCLLAIQVLSK